MNTQHSSVNDGAQRHEIEYLTAGLPYRSISVFLEALFVETVYLCDLAGLVVATDQRHPIWESGKLAFLSLAGKQKKLTSPSNTTAASMFPN